MLALVASHDIPWHEAGQCALQSAREEAKATSERAAALQEQLNAVQVRLQEAHAAKESSAAPSKEVTHPSLPLQPVFTCPVSIV